MWRLAMPVAVVFGLPGCIFACDTQQRDVSWDQVEVAQAALSKIPRSSLQYTVHGNWAFPDPRAVPGTSAINGIDFHPPGQPLAYAGAQLLVDHGSVVWLQVEANSLSQEDAWEMAHSTAAQFLAEIAGTSPEDQFAAANEWLAGFNSSYGNVREGYNGPDGEPLKMAGASTKLRDFGGLAALIDRIVAGQASGWEASWDYGDRDFEHSSDELWGGGTVDGLGHVHVWVWKEGSSVSKSEAHRFIEEAFAQQGWPAPTLADARESSSCGDDW